MSRDLCQERLLGGPRLTGICPPWTLCIWFACDLHTAVFAAVREYGY